MGTALDTVRDYMDKHKVQIRKATPAGVNAENLRRSLLAEIQADAKLAACTPKSIIKCLAEMHRYGLDVGGIGGKAYIIPYGKDAQFQVGYKGVKELVRRSGEGQLVMAEVREGDGFEDQGPMTLPKHIPSKDVRRHEKTLTYVYAAYVPKEGVPVVTVWSRERCLAHRKAFSKGYKGKKTDAWHEENPSFSIMCMKTAVMYLAGRGDLPLSPDVMSKLDGVREFETVEPESVTVHSAAAPVALPEPVEVAPDAVVEPIRFEEMQQRLEECHDERQCQQLQDELTEMFPEQAQEIFDCVEIRRGDIATGAK